jgi:hypothetical protein
MLPSIFVLEIRKRCNILLEFELQHIAESESLLGISCFILRHGFPNMI